MPLVQAGPLGVRQDESALLALLSGGNAPHGHIHLASGYFNFTKAYERLLLESSHSMKILTASPRANGFFGSRGASGLIPPAYTFIERNFLSRVDAAAQQERLSVHEYERPGWTFHAKGMWFTPGEEGDQGKPVMTMVGSPNYGARSVDRDVEAQVMLCTTAEGLRRQLASERDALFKYSSRVRVEDLEKEERKSSLTVKTVTPLIQDYF